MDAMICTAFDPSLGAAATTGVIMSANANANASVMHEHVHASAWQPWLRVTNARRRCKQLACVHKQNHSFTDVRPHV